MIQPATFRFVVRSALGAYKATIQKEASYVLRSGFRMSVTPEGICEEMTITARNGVHPLDGSPGLGLRFADIVTVQMAASENPTDSDWVSLYYGQLRVGGNPHDFEGENMVLRSLAVKLRATPTPDKGYAQMDAGALARQLLLDTLASGVLGMVVFPSLTIPPSPEGPRDTRIIRYDASAIPDLGFNMTLLATNQQPLGVLLDTIVATAKSAGIEVRWGVRADGVLTLRAVSTLEISWPAEEIQWKEPSAEVMYTGVMWDVYKRPDGTWLKYLSTAPEAALYGVEQKEVAIGTGVKVWRPLVVDLNVVSGASMVFPVSGTPGTVTRDGDTTSFLSVSNNSGPSSVSLTIPEGGADRLYVDAQGSALPASIQISYPNGGSYSMRANDPNGGGFTAGVYFSDYFFSGLPAGAVLTLSAGSGTPGSATALTVKEFHLDVLDKALLDGLAKYHYQVPESAPGDLYRTGLLLPGEYGGKIRTPRPNGEADYTANVSLWEYSVWDEGGVRTAAKTGDPDDPEVAAQWALVRKGDVLATANAVNLP